MRRAWLLLVLLAGCPKPPPPQVVDAGPPTVVSQDILMRPVQSSSARVQHILISWHEMKDNYPHGRIDPRAAMRTRADADELVRSVLLRARGSESFEALMREVSEEPDSARVGGSYEVRANGQMEPAFQSIALRLRVGEIGVCQSDYGYHVVKRIQ